MTESELILPTAIRELTDADSDGYTVDGTPLNFLIVYRKYLRISNIVKL